MLFFFLKLQLYVEYIDRLYTYILIVFKKRVILFRSNEKGKTNIK